MINAPGIYDLDAAAYHADPCATPSLSSGLARLLVERSPLHAWHAHPRLNPYYAAREASPAMVRGTILHKMLLGKGDDYVAIEADDWRTKAAKEARDEAIAAGLVPILAGALAELKDACVEARDQMRGHPACGDFFGPGRSEAALVWREGDVWCRAMVDRLPDRPGAPLYDIKTTAGSAAPEEWQRRLVRDYAFQAAFYMRGARALGLRPADFLFPVIECEPPYAMCVQAAAPSMMAVADRDVQRAIDLWGRCLRNKQWPGYPTMIAYAEAPSWALARLDDRDFNDEQIQEYAA